MPSPIDRGLWGVAAALVLSAGCAFDEGEPWGRADLALSAAFRPAEGRLTPEGLLKTSSDYAVDLASLEVAVAGVSLVLGPPGEAAPGGFDPADPPEGYGQCHNGHCHSEDGRLVSYEDIAAEAGLPAGEGFRLEQAALPGAVEVAGGEAPVPLAACPDACRLEEGTLSGLEATISGLQVRGRVFDRRTGEARRLPEAGVPFRGRWQGSLVLEARLEGDVGPGKALPVRVRGTLGVTDRLLDGVEFAAGPLPAGSDELDLAAVGGALDALRAAMAEHGTLAADVARD